MLVARQGGGGLSPMGSEPATWCGLVGGSQSESVAQCAQGGGCPTARGVLRRTVFSHSCCRRDSADACSTCEREITNSGGGGKRHKPFGTGSHGNGKK